MIEHTGPFALGLQLAEAMRVPTDVLDAVRARSYCCSATLLLRSADAQLQATTLAAMTELRASGQTTPEPLELDLREGQLLVMMGRRDAAVERLTAAAASPAEWVAVRAEMALGLASLVFGDTTEARSRFERAMARATRLDDASLVGLLEGYIAAGPLRGEPGSAEPGRRSVRTDRRAPRCRSRPGQSRGRPGQARRPRGLCA